MPKRKLDCSVLTEVPAGIVIFRYKRAVFGNALARKKRGIIGWDVTEKEKPRACWRSRKKWWYI